MKHVLLSLALLAPALAGCLGTTVEDTPTAQGLPEDVLPPLAFTPLQVIDAVRPGGEPVIAITPTGTILVSAHPGPTHTQLPPAAGLVSNYAAQSYIWRSTDNGTTFEPVSIAGPAGPAGPWAGVSDPDFAIDANGRIYFTDLGPLTHAAVAWSDDEGATWMANPIASGAGPTDRQWIATVGTDVYFTSNYFTEKRVLKSADGGLTWTHVGNANCGSDMSAGADGTLYIGCGKEFEVAIDVSEDGGATWEKRPVPDANEIYRTLTEPAVDAAGNVYLTWTNETGIFYAATPDKGKTWTPAVDLSEYVNGNMTALWPWIVAGDEGRVAVAWFGLETGEDPAEATGDWHVYLAVITDANSGAPQVHAARATSEPFHQGAICQNGTVCQLPAGPTTGDRRLGDFFEITADPWGYVHGVFAVTTSGDSISHPGYFKQLEGPSLYLTPRLAPQEE